MKGVNCVDYFTGGDKPYLITGSDDHTAKVLPYFPIPLAIEHVWTKYNFRPKLLTQVWDYQTKSCVQTLEGHTHNVSAVCFHPELPIIITGSEDGTVRIWHSTTYRWVECCKIFYWQGFFWPLPFTSWIHALQWAIYYCKWFSSSISFPYPFSVFFNEYRSVKLNRVIFCFLYDRWYMEISFIWCVNIWNMLIKFSYTFVNYRVSFHLSYILDSFHLICVILLTEIENLIFCWCIATPVMSSKAKMSSHFF